MRKSKSKKFIIKFMYAIERNMKAAIPDLRRKFNKEEFTIT